VTFASRADGFTLMEVMLATLVLALVVAMVTASLSGSLKVVDATRLQGDIYYRGQVALQRVRADLQAAVLPEDVDFIGLEEEEAGTSEDMLRFGSLAHLLFDPDNELPGMGIIRYAVRPDKNDDQSLVLLRADRLYRPGQDSGKDEAAYFVLCDQLRAVRFRYFDDQGEEHEKWTTKTDDPEVVRRLPAAVSCTLEFWLDREAETTLTMEARVVLPAGLLAKKKKEKS